MAILILTLLILFLICFVIPAIRNNRNSFNNITSYENDYSCSSTKDTYYSFEDKYWDKLSKQLEKYNDLCSDTKDQFENCFNITKRIKMLQKCISFLDKVKETYNNMGPDGITLFNEETSSYYESWNKNDIYYNHNIDNYQFEFIQIDFSNYKFLNWLLNLYETDTENQKEHLKQENHYCEIIDNYGSEAGYQQVMDDEKKYNKLCQNVLKQIENEPDILQSKLIKNFPEQSPSYMRKLIQDLADKNKIVKNKSGNSYTLKAISKK